jgi:hypothetical protein
MQIFYQISLDPLLSAALSRFNRSIPQNTATRTGRGVRDLLTNLPNFLRLIHFVVITALVLSVVGGNNRALTRYVQIDEWKYDSGATYLRVSSILSLVALAGITYGLLRY